MGIQFQLRRGTTSENQEFTGAEGEVTIDTEKHTLRIHDGTTQGGAREIGKAINIQFTGDVTGEITDFDMSQDISVALTANKSADDADDTDSASGTGVPVGTIIYAASLLPCFAKCNGATVKRDEYQLLTQYIEDNNLWTDDQETYPGLFGEGDGKTTLVLPNLIDHGIQGSVKDIGKVVDGGLSTSEGSSVLLIPQIQTGEEHEEIPEKEKTGLYGIKINKNESDPDLRVEYIYDAEGMQPAKMDFATGQFDYGDWADLWFIKENKPCMLNYNGTVDYYLKPNNYNQREDGQSSNISSSYNGNIMAQIPLVWVYRYEDDNYIYEIICDHQYDSNYHAYAHTDANGNVKNNFYYACFNATGNDSQFRSIYGDKPTKGYTSQGMMNAAKANGNNWNMVSWSQHELIRTLLFLISKSTNSQAKFGTGNCPGFTVATSVSALCTTGSLINKGQFYGVNNNNTTQVKVFHIEGFWGDQSTAVVGLLAKNNKIYVKMTPGYTGYLFDDVYGYTDTSLTTNDHRSSLISAVKCNEYGMIPTGYDGSETTYYCDGVWGVQDDSIHSLDMGANARTTTFWCGAMAFGMSACPGDVYWHKGTQLAYV